MSAESPNLEAEEPKPAEPAPSTVVDTGPKRFDFAADDPEPEDWIAPDAPLKQEPITQALSETNVPSGSTAGDSVQKDGEAKEAPDSAEFIVKDEVASEDGEGGTKTEESPSYFCETCQETSPETEEAHLKGRRHLKIVERLEKYGSLEKIAEAFKTVYCFICGAKSNSVEQLEIHVKGNKHKNRCKSFNVDPSLTNFPPGMKIPPGVKPPPGYTPDAKGPGPQTPAPQAPAPKAPAPKAPAPKAPAPKPAGAAPPTGDKKTAQAPGGKDAGADAVVRAERPVCDVCNITLSSPQQLIQHLGGKKHKDLVENLKAMAMFQLPMKRPQQNKGLGGRPDGMPPFGQPMRPPAAPKSGNFDKGFQKGAKRPLLQDGGPGPIKKPNMGAGGAAAAPGGPGGPPVLKKSFYCKLCDTTLNSEFQRDEHMNGRVHKERLAGGPLPTAQQGPQLQPNRPPQQFRQPQPNWGAHQNKPLQGKPNQGVGPKPRMGMGQPQQRMPAPKGMFSCAPCQQSMNSQMQYDQHMTSKKHFQRLEMLASGEPVGMPGTGSKKPLFRGPNTAGGPPNIRPRAPNVYSTAKPWSTSNSSKPMPFNSGGNRFGAPQQQQWVNPNTRPQQHQQHKNGSMRPSFPNQPAFPGPGSQQFQMNTTPQQKPLLGGPGFGSTPSDHLSKLQYDLAVEISKLSRQLTRPDFAQETGQQGHHFQQNLQQDHQSMDSFDRSHDQPYGDSMNQSHAGDGFGSGNMYDHGYQEPQREASYNDEFEPPSAASRRTLLPSTPPAFERQGLLDRLRSLSGSAQATNIDTYGERRPHDRSDYKYGSSELGYGDQASFGDSEYAPAEYKTPLLPDRGRPSSSLLGRPFDYNSRF